MSQPEEPALPSSSRTEAHRPIIASSATVQGFASGSVMVIGHPWSWLEPPGRRIPALLDDLPKTRIEVLPGEYYQVIDPDQRHRTLSLFLAGHATLAAAFGITLCALSLPAPGHDTLGRPVVSRLPRDATVPLPALTALHLAGQVAVEIDLARRWLRDPHRILAAWMITSTIEDLARAETEPVAYLFGPRTEAPANWSGPAVHIDHLRRHLRDWLNEHWDTVETNAARLRRNARPRLARIGRRAVPHAPRAPACLPAAHPLFATTEIPAAAIDAAAAWWTRRIRARLGRGFDPGDRDDRVDEDQLERFRIALTEQVRTRIERRTRYAHGGLHLRVTGSGDDEYTLGSVTGYDTPAPLKTALHTAGLPPGLLYPCRDAATTLTATSTWATTRQGVEGLWRSPPAWPPAP